MPILSIIVPIYKAEAYLAKCVDSLLSQSLPDLEIILVDDGSPDGSGAICDEYAAKHQNIRVIHKENEGQTATRKAGLRIATGKYVAFVDSDDWVDSDMFAPMVAKAEAAGADIVATGFMRDFDNRQEAGRNGYPSGVYTGEELTRLRENALYYEPEKCEGIAPALWAKIFHRENTASAILSRNDTIRFGEDSLCTNAALCRAKCVVVDNDLHGYHYRIWGGSITQAYYVNYFHDLFLLHDELKGIYAPWDSPAVRKAIANNYVNLYLGGILQELSKKPGAVRRLKAVGQDGRLAENLSYVNLQVLSGRMTRYLRFMEKNQPVRLFIFHQLCRAAGFGKRLIKRN